MSEQELKDELDSLIREAEKAGFKFVACMLCAIRASTEDHSEEVLADHIMDFVRVKLQAIRNRNN